MAKPMFDADALIEQFQNASARGGAQLKQATSQALLTALQGRELTLKNIRSALQQVATAASTGASLNVAGVDPTTLLDKAVAGMDEALLKAVEANRTALATLSAQGADLRDKHLQKALSDLEKMEDTMFAAIKKAAAGAEAPLQNAWAPLLEKMQAGGTLSGAQAAKTAEDLVGQMHSAMRQTRAASMKAAQALAESYTAMVSGVLLGMSEALQSGAAEAPRKSTRK